MLICKNCNERMRVKKNGIIVEIDGRTKFSADLYACPSCGHENITAFGERITAHHEKNYNNYVTEVSING